jgi:tetratricopeptide (TPR) repeat protein
MAVFGLAVFLGAFLLFQVQPLMGKFILPWFGGAPAVWTSCMVVFQALLLAGYAYAHLAAKCRLRTQVILHLVIVALALVSLPITPSPDWKPATTSDPTARIILLLTVSLGLPFFALSATAPLLQQWFSRSTPASSPYRLYALSNAGSLLALLTYPVLFEPRLTRVEQATLWSAGLAFYAIACALCGWKVWKAPETTGPAATQSDEQAPNWVNRVLWVLLPACASILLLAVTNKLCQDVAVVAFLWVLPLAVYLLSFIICFERQAWYKREVFGPALLLSLLLIGGMLSGVFDFSIPVQIATYLAGLFVICMVCHGELYRLRPHPSRLTAFYLSVAAGGALGGIFVALGAPAMFPDYFELQWGLVLCVGLFVWVSLRQTGETETRRWRIGALAGGTLVLAGLCAMYYAEAVHYAPLRAYRTRNFYGVLNVFAYNYREAERSQMELMHGKVVHGMQFTHPGRVQEPTLYFTSGSGIGRVLRTPHSGKRNIGVVGLGVGTLTTYLEPGERMRFYEINPQVEHVARNFFQYLKMARGEVQVVLGDARLAMETESPQNFDVLVLDAFNSDAIPVHLLTAEAFQVYGRHLRTNGVLAIHVSNASVNLEPVVFNLARKFGYEAEVIEHRGSPETPWVLPSTWVVLARDPRFLKAPAMAQGSRPPVPASFEVPLWTDDFSGLAPVLRWSDFFGTKAKPIRELRQSAATLVGQGNLAETIASLREAANRNPDSPAALNNLACLLATAPDPALRDGPRAVELAEKACALGGNPNAVLLSTLAAAYAEVGRFDEAVATAERACTLARQAGEQQILERTSQLLEFYRRKQPYHQLPPQAPR